MSFLSIQDRGVDTNGNGLYEWLEVRVELVFEVSTWFVLEAYLDLDPYFSAYRRVDGFAGVGATAIDLSFEAVYFNASGRDGPYSIRIVLSASYGTSLSQTYLTAAYLATDFEA
ncbi:MAG: hypothetical protein ACT4OI_02075 [Methanobacteriota archaeon]